MKNPGVCNFFSSSSLFLPWLPPLMMVGTLKNTNNVCRSVWSLDLTLTGWQRFVTYWVHVGQVVEEHLASAHLVPHSSYGPVLAADVDPLVAEHHLSLDAGVQKQVVRFTPVLVHCGLPRRQAVQMSVGLAGGQRAALLRLGAAGTVRVHWVWSRATPGSVVLEHLSQDPAAVGRRYPKPDGFPSFVSFLLHSWLLHGNISESHIVYIPSDGEQCGFTASTMEVRIHGAKISCWRVKGSRKYPE